MRDTCILRDEHETEDALLGCVQAEECVYQEHPKGRTHTKILLWYLVVNMYWKQT